jgi:hypothetical protein
MTISKIWNVESIDVLNNLFQYQNVVRKVSWKITVQNDGQDGTPLQVMHLNGTVNLDLPYDLATYQNFDTITESDILNWVFSALGTKKHDFEVELETYMLSMLMNNDSNMIIENKPLPWTTTS